MSKPKRGLGRALSDMGVEALLSEVSADPANAQIQMLALSVITPNPNQPRKTFRAHSLEELAASISAHGIIQPIVVTEPSPGKFEIIAGERRYRAAKQAGLTDIPAIVKNLDELAAESIAIIENVQREDLNPLDQAQAYARLIDVYQLSHDDIASKVNKSRSSISNILRLNKLHPEAKTLLKEGAIDMGHARALLGAPYEKQPLLAQRIVKQQLSVRQVEQLLKPKLPSTPSRPDTQWIVSRLKDHKIQAKVRGNSEKGSITLKYDSPHKLESLLKSLTNTENEPIKEIA